MSHCSASITVRQRWCATRWAASTYVGLIGPRESPTVCSSLDTTALDEPCTPITASGTAGTAGAARGPFCEIPWRDFRLAVLADCLAPRTVPPASFGIWFSLSDVRLLLPSADA
eukprot:scaffold27928_cov115-Isochrysis_galbana.AAC.7